MLARKTAMALPSPIEPTLVVAPVSSTTQALEPGSAVGEYLVEELIGEGGFGAVYAANHPMIGKRAAVKVLSREFSSDPSLAARFINEARAVNTIRHHNIVDIFSFGRLKDQRLYLIMEMLEGESLETYLRRKGRLEVAEMLGIFHAIARALDATHAAGIVHRDLKPANVYLAIDSDGVVTPKLLDFGIAKLEANANYIEHAPTETGTVMGTPAYMAPEQCKGESVSALADVYSFGIMVHRALTGKVPFDGKNVLSVAVMQTVARAPAMSEVATDLPSALDAPVLRMLAKDPGDRPASVGEAYAALAEAAGLALPPRSASPADLMIPAPVSHLRRLGRNNWVRGGSIAVAAALVGALTVGWLTSRQERANAAPQRAVDATLPTGAAAPALAPGLPVRSLASAQSARRARKPMLQPAPTPVSHTTTTRTF